jgi:hypothetical protein
MRHLLWPGKIVANLANPVWIRTATVSDLDHLSEYFENLSQSSRYNRFMGAVSNVSKIAFDCLKQGWRPGHFTLVAEWRASRAAMPSSQRQATASTAKGDVASSRSRSPIACSIGAWFGAARRAAVSRHQPWPILSGSARP